MTASGQLRRSRTRPVSSAVPEQADIDGCIKDSDRHPRSAGPTVSKVLQPALNFKGDSGFAIYNRDVRLACGRVYGRRGDTGISEDSDVRKLEPLYTVTETAKILNLSEKTVRRLIKDESLRAIGLCRGDGRRGSVRVAPADLEDFIRDHRSR